MLRRAAGVCDALGDNALTLLAAAWMAVLGADSLLYELEWVESAWRWKADRDCFIKAGCSKIHLGIFSSGEAVVVGNFD